jgi:hypothetical protein
VRRGGLGQPSLADSLGHLLLRSSLVQMMAVSDAGAGVDIVRGRGNDELPSPLPVRVQGLSLQGIGERRSTEAVAQVDCGGRLR